MALRFEADADGLNHVTINLPPGHPAEEDLKATGYDFADAELSAFIYALTLWLAYSKICDSGQRHRRPDLRRGPAQGRCRRIDRDRRGRAPSALQPRRTAALSARPGAARESLHAHPGAFRRAKHRHSFRDLGNGRRFAGK